MIYHFITETDLARDLTGDTFAPPSLTSEGFIHCSTLEQVLAVANFLAPYSEEMKLLAIDDSLVTPEIKWEDSMQDGRLFPHIYGTLNRNAITATHHLDWDGEEGYALPQELQ